MSIKVTLAILAGRCVKLAAKILRRGGTAKPGEIALKLCPDLPARLAKDMRIIVVTGTNGKTTTCRIVEQALQDGGIDCTANRSGANLMSGLTTMLMENASLTGKPKKTVAVFECDEAAFRRVVPMIKPEVALVTNLFRDQLDRYGSMENVRALILEGIQGSPDTKVVLNADCSLTASMAGDVSNSCTFYGFGEALGGGEVPAVSAAPNCIRCGEPYEYDYRIYGHLGAFRCPKCGFKKPEMDVTVAEIPTRDADSSVAKVVTKNGEYTVRINLPADYNVYNAVGAATAAMVFGIGEDVALGACEHFACSFGRMEKMSYKDMTFRMILIKNAVGCDRVVDYLSGVKEDFLPVFLLNNKPADGTDYSWIYDANFEKLAAVHGSKALVSGMCADDLAKRLVDAGFAADGVVVEKDMDKLVQRMTEHGGNVFVIPNYTTMLEIHGRLAALCGTEQFWEK